MPESVTIIRAAQLGEEARGKIGEIFTSGFSQWLRYFSADEAKLREAFSHMFNLEVFYVAMLGEEIVGIAACTDGIIPSVRLSKGELKEHLGQFKGRIAYRVLKREFEDKPYPFDIETDMGLIEFVATAPQHRGKGVATQLIANIIASTSFTVYALEVADTNEGAVRLYERLGFSEFMRIQQEQSEKSGVDNLLYMVKFDTPQE